MSDTTSDTTSGQGAATAPGGPGAPGAPGGDDGLDLGAVLADIEEEVRARRASGELPASFERELDEVFERLVPDEVGGQDLTLVIDAAERAAFLDVQVPVESRNPAFATVKKAVRKLVLWYMEHLARQVGAFGGTVVRGLRLLAGRTEDLETRVAALEDARREQEAVPPLVARALAGARPEAAAPGPPDDWDALLVEALDGAAGRVAHLGAGEGRLVRVLVDAGVDAYGVDPRPASEAGGGAGDVGLELRAGDPLEHLEQVTEAGLAGLVLTGFVDGLPLPAKVRLVELAARALAADGHLTLVASWPDAWAAERTPLEADLAPGRPLHPETWRALLAAAGFGEVEVVEGQGGGAEVAVLARRRR